MKETIVEPPEVSTGITAPTARRDRQRAGPNLITWLASAYSSAARILLTFPSYVFLAASAFYLLLTCVHLWLASAVNPETLPTTLTGWETAFTESWRRFDTIYFLKIAHRGYTNENIGAFFPLYPLLIRLVAWLTNGHFMLAALAVSWLCSWGSYLWFYRLAEREYGKQIAQRALLFLAFCPIGLFSFAAYSEPLFLLVSIGAVERARTGHHWQAGALGALAMLTRPTGILLLIPLGWECARRTDWFARLRVRLLEGSWLRPSLSGAAPSPSQPVRRGPARSGPLTHPSQKTTWHPASARDNPHSWAWLSLVLIPLALASYMLYLKIATNNPLAFLHGEHAWNRHLTLPWETLGLFATAFQYAWQTSDYTVAIGNIVDLLLTVPLPITVLYLALCRRTIWFGAALYQLALTLLLVSIPIHPGPQGPYEIFFSTQRFMLPAFPLFLLMGHFGLAHPRLYRALLIASGLLLALNTLRFLENIFIA